MSPWTSSLLLPVHVQPVGLLVDTATRTAMTRGEMGMRIRVIANAAAAVVPLLTAAGLSGCSSLAR